MPKAKDIGKNKKFVRRIVWLCVAGAVVLSILITVITLSVQYSLPTIAENYWEDQTAGGEIEKKYAKLGPYAVDAREYTAANYDGGAENHYKVWFPADAGTAAYPLVIMVNGTGCPYQRYEDIFYHLASWGFVVAGNDYETSGDGKAADETLEFVLQDEELSAMVDKDRIGIGGHSQGGMGAFNAITQYENGSLYKVCFSLSCVSPDLANFLGWHFTDDAEEDDMPAGTEEVEEESGAATGDTTEEEPETPYTYDTDGIGIPTLMLAGTAGFEGMIVSQEDLQDSFDGLQGDAVLARREDTSHGDLLWQADPYVTAWLMYYLQGDAYAGRAFFGDYPELSLNENWQDFANKTAA